jgi:hypothetical protein
MIKRIAVGLIVLAAIVLTVSDLLATDSAVTVESVAPTGPARERYAAPVWVTNEQGQRCIQQGTTVTCG